jgi:hypothetical protein
MSSSAAKSSASRKPRTFSFESARSPSPDETGFRSRRYNFGLFSQANRALQAAIKVSLRIDDEGFLSLQMMMPPPVGKRLDNSSDSGIIEFKLTALQEED